MRIAIVGTGYVGLVTGVCFAHIGHEVICVDSDPSKIERLKNHDLPIYEPGLADLIAICEAEGRLSFTTSIAEAAARECEFFFIAVGTPPRQDTGHADLSYVYEATDEVGAALLEVQNGYDFTVIVTKSTVPVGTNREVSRILAKHLPEDRFAVASNPEFLREGNAIQDFLEPDRIIVGSDSDRAKGLLEELYRPLTRQGYPLVMTGAVETAELIKYTANAFLATKISFINEIARLSEQVGGNIDEISLGVGLDKRIGKQFMNAGPGYGGSCFPKDTLALIKTANDFGSPVEIVETVVRANDRHKQMMVNKIKSVVGRDLSGKRIGVLGLAFKANTDDIRDAPSLTILPTLQNDGAKIVAYDPEAMSNAKELLPWIDLAESAADVFTSADVTIILTEWPQFKAIQWAKMACKMAAPIVIDLRNILNPESMGRHGFQYYGLGR